jgi:hypothetical protein
MLMVVVVMMMTWRCRWYVVSLLVMVGGNGNAWQGRRVVGGGRLSWCRSVVVVVCRSHSRT